MASPARPNTTAMPSPPFANTAPRLTETAWSNKWSWRASAALMAAGSCSHRRVESSMSVNRKVTVPDGSSTATPPLCQSGSACRSTDRRRFRRRGATTAGTQHAIGKRCTRSTKQPRSPATSVPSIGVRDLGPPRPRPPAGRGSMTWNQLACSLSRALQIPRSARPCPYSTVPQNTRRFAVAEAPTNAGTMTWSQASIVRAGPATFVWGAAVAGAGVNPPPAQPPRRGCPGRSCADTRRSPCRPRRSVARARLSPRRTPSGQRGSSGCCRRWVRW